MKITGGNGTGNSMAQVNVSINNRSYDLACEDGEETHLRELARFVDRQVDDLRRNFGHIGDSRLLVMAALMIADQLSEALTRIEDVEKELASLKQTGSTASDQTRQIEDAAIRDIEGLAERLEDLAREISA